MTSQDIDKEWNWINPGQSITCDKGHIIATAMQRVELGTGDDWMDKLKWQIEPPHNGEISSCPVCGSLWFLSFKEEAIRWHPRSLPIYRRTTWICIDGEWHKPLTPKARAYVDSFLLLYHSTPALKLD